MRLEIASVYCGAWNLGDKFQIPHRMQLSITTTDLNEIEPAFTAPMERMERKAERMKTLLEMGGTLENKGETLHILDLRIAVSGLSEMDEGVWQEVRRSIEELEAFDEKGRIPIDKVDRLM